MDGSAPLLVDSKKLKALRRKAGLSQEALADACQQRRIRLSIATIKRAEAGKSVAPRTLTSLADFFAVPVEALLVIPDENVMSSAVDSEQRSRACMVLVVKFSTSQQKEYLTRAIGKASPVLVDIHGGYILAGFRSCHAETKNSDGADADTNRILELCRELQQTVQLTSVVSPIFCLVTFAHLQESERGYHTDRILLNRLAEQIRLLPSNRVVCCDGFRQLYETSFLFQSVSIATSLPYWMLELKSPVQLSAMYGVEQELARFEDLKSQAVSGCCCVAGLVVAPEGGGKSHFLHALSCQTVAPFISVRADLEMGDLSLHQAVQEVEQSFQQTIQGAAPVLLLVDNVHCASIAQSQELQRLKVVFADYPLIVVLSCDQARYQQVAEVFYCNLSVFLSRLDDSDCLRLSCHFTDVSDTSRRESIQRSAGHPLSLKVLLGQSERLRESLPVTLQWLFSQQVESLSYAEKTVICWLAAAGLPLSGEQLGSLTKERLSEQVLDQYRYISRLPSGLLALRIPVMGEAITAELTAEERRHYHLQLAKMGELVEGESLEHAGWVAEQFALAGDCFGQLRYLSVVIGRLIEIGEYESAELNVVEALKVHTEWISLERSGVEQDELTAASLKMELLTHYVNICKVLYGWDSPVVSDLYQQMQELSELTGDVRYRVAGLFGVWSTTLIRLDLAQAMGYAREALQLAYESGDISGQVQALSAQSNTAFWMGDMQKAYVLSNEAISLYPATGLSDPLLINGQDPRMLALCFRALSAARLGLSSTPQFVQELLHVGQGISHPFSKAIALQGAAWYYWMLRQPEQVKLYSRQLREIATEHSFPFYRGMAVLFEGWADYQITGDIVHLDTISSGFQRWLSSTAHKLMHSIYSVIAADVLITDNQHALARELLVEAIRELEVKGAYCYLPEIYRLMSRVDVESELWLSRALSLELISPLDRERLMEEYRLWVKK